VDKVVSARRVESTIRDTLILLFEECGEGWAVATSVLGKPPSASHPWNVPYQRLCTYRLSPNANSIIIRLVIRKFLKPSLREVPHSFSSILGVVCRCILVSTRECPHIKCIILLRYRRCREIHNRCVPTCQIPGPIRWDVVRKADLVWLINVQHVDFVVP